MSNVRRFGTLGLLALVTVSLQWKAHADGIKTVFVIALENHNWTQPASQTSPQQIFQNPAAPFINSLVNGRCHRQWAPGQHQPPGSLCHELPQRPVHAERE
jgi:hypothetical protein